MPFPVAVSSMDKVLAGKPIRLRVLDTVSYHLSDPGDTLERTSIGEFDTVLDEDWITINIPRPPDLDDATFGRVIANTRHSDFELKVYAY